MLKCMSILVQVIIQQETKLLVCANDMFGTWQEKHYFSLRMLLLLINTHVQSTLNIYKSSNCKLVNITHRLQRSHVNVALCKASHAYRIIYSRLPEYSANVDSLWASSKESTCQFQQFLVTSFTNYLQYSPNNILVRSNNAVSTHRMISERVLVKAKR